MVYEKVVNKVKETFVKGSINSNLSQKRGWKSQTLFIPIQTFINTYKYANIFHDESLGRCIYYSQIMPINHTLTKSFHIFSYSL